MKKKDFLRFRRIGSCRQVLIANADDMKKLASLDSALWAVNSIPVNAVEADSEFLKFLDSDENGRIRIEEMRKALQWLLGVLKDYSGINEGSDVLSLDAFDETHPESAMLKSSIQLILNNMNLREQKTVSLAELRNTASIIGAGNSNGDGIVTLENTSDPELAVLIANIMRVVGSKTDLSTLQGIDEEFLNEYVKRASARLAWLKAGNAIEMESVYREKAGDFFKSYLLVKEKLDEFFVLCGALRNENDGVIANTPAFDPLNVKTMQDFIENAPVAELSFRRTLDITKWLNPKNQTQILDFMSKAFDAGAVADAKLLTLQEYEQIKSNFANRMQWNESAADPNFDGMSIEALEADLAEATVGKMRKLIKSDLSVASEINAVQQLRKLALYQQNMLRFVNNFISLSDLFNPRSLSMVQPGYLIMDGRYFSLCTCVDNIAEHKKIIQRSNICVMYLSVECIKNKEVRKMTVAAAITSGTMRNIFIGKSGVFYSGDGTEYDAKIIDLVQQPVSFKEALLQPFYTFGSFIGKQADKFFSTRSKDVEGVLNKQVDSAAKGKGTIVDTKAVQQTPAISGSMLLMGGGVGLAALGSSVAFIANSVQQVPFWKIAAVLFGIIFTISAPMMLVSLVKLKNRSISDFFSAGSWAVNLRMRLSRKMGLLFTHNPKIPFGATLRGDLIDLMQTEIKLKNTDKKNQ